MTSPRSVFGQVGSAESKRIGIRYSDGDFQDAVYRVDGSKTTVNLFPVREGGQGPARDYTGTVDVNAETTGGGEHTLRTGG